MNTIRLLVILMICHIYVGVIKAEGVDVPRYCIDTYSEYSLGNETRLHDFDDIYEINVVFHVVYHTDEQNINDSQIQSQIEVLNLDFRNRNLDSNQVVNEFSALVTDAKIQFRLAQLDPSGNVTNGINRYYTDHGTFANNDIFYTDLGGYDGWDSSKYLNIWITDLAQGVLGYASSPDELDDEDGIVLNYDVVGKEGNDNTPYDLGRTLTHELGHYLGLSHLWGAGGCESDDAIDDTPNQESATFSCDLSSSSCGSTDMVQNFMNLVDDDCMLFFTTGQVSMMRNNLISLRPDIWNIVDDIPLVTKSDLNTVIEIYPNPAKDGYIDVIYKGSSIIKKISIVHINGKVQLEKFDFYLTKNRIDINQLKAGVYLANFQTSHQIVSKKLIISRR